MASSSHAEGLATALAERVGPGSKVLLVRPEVARPVLADRLRALGARVVATPFYRTVAGPGGDDAAAEIGEGRYDAVVFSSPSTLSSLLDAGDRLGPGV